MLKIDKITFFGVHTANFSAIPAARDNREAIFNTSDAFLETVSTF